MPYTIPKVTVKEVDQSQVPVTSVGDLSCAFVIKSPWGNPDITLLTQAKELVKKYTYDGKPDSNDVQWLSAYHLLGNRVSCYIKRAYGSGAKGANLIVVKEDAVGDSSPNGVGFDWPTTSYSFSADDLFAIYFYPGVIGNKYSFIVKNTDSNTYTFDLEIYKDNDVGTAILYETITISRKNIVDGFGRNIYVENAYYFDELDLPFRIIDNKTFVDTILPKENGVGIYAADGTDGDAIDDATIVANYDIIKNDNKNFQVVISAGHTDTTVATKLVDIADNRGDLVGRRTTCLIDGPNDTDTYLVDTFRATFSTSNSRVSILAEWHQYTDIFNRNQVYLPPSVIVMELLVKNRLSPFADISGISRGSFNTEGLAQSYNSVQAENLIQSQINPLFKDNQGYYLLDLFTALTTSSTFSFFNNRIFFDYMADVITAYVKPFLKTYNNPNNRRQISEKIQQIIDNFIITEELISGSVVCDSSNNTDGSDTYIVDVYLQRPLAVREIQISLIATGSSITVTEG